MKKVFSFIFIALGVFFISLGISIGIINHHHYARHKMAAAVSKAIEKEDVTIALNNIPVKDRLEFTSLLQRFTNGSTLNHSRVLEGEVYVDREGNKRIPMTLMTYQQGVVYDSLYLELIEDTNSGEVTYTYE